MPDLTNEKSQTTTGNSSIGLKVFLNGVESAVKKLPSAWVRCELHQLKVMERFVRMEFIELDGSGNQLARAQGGCWPDVWREINSTFCAAGLKLETGSQVLVKLQARINPTFGFQVDVLDIDLTFALGDLTARIQAIKTHLVTEGKWNKNRSLPRPKDFIRVAVISPKGAAGLGDFRSSADSLEDAGLITFTYFEAPFQTREAPSRIVDILREIYRKCKAEESRYCAVAIIRGGGASTDLAWLIDPTLAEAVSLMNIPVITGIGHERDRNLLDEIACIPCATPSKVAEHISTTILRAATDAGHAFQSIQSNVTGMLDKERSTLTSLLHSLERDAKETVRVSEIVVRNITQKLEPGVRVLLDQTNVEVLIAIETVRSAARQRRETASNSILSLSRSISQGVENSLRPLNISAERTLSEIMTRVESVPQVAKENTAQLLYQVTSGAQQTTDDVCGCLNNLNIAMISGVRQTITYLGNNISRVQERADSLHPKTVLAAGYSILRNEEGVPLTNILALRTAGLMQAEMRDGTAKLQVYTEK